MGMLFVTAPHTTLRDHAPGIGRCPARRPLAKLPSGAAPIAFREVPRQCGRATVSAAVADASAGQVSFLKCRLIVGPRTACACATMKFIASRLHRNKAKLDAGLRAAYHWCARRIRVVGDHNRFTN